MFRLIYWVVVLSAKFSLLVSFFNIGLGLRRGAPDFPVDKFGGLAVAAGPG